MSSREGSWVTDQTTVHLYLRGVTHIVDSQAKLDPRPSGFPEGTLFSPVTGAWTPGISSLAHPRPLPVGEEAAAEASGKGAEPREHVPYPACWKAVSVGSAGRRGRQGAVVQNSSSSSLEEWHREHL